jgi:glycosyltransferase involved in cell wall biosynthesis
MKILLVSGIWPPAVGGPASHGPEFGRFLRDRGHRVEAVTTAGPEGAIDPAFPLTVSGRNRPRIVRLPAGALTILAAARRAELIYAIGIYGRSALASRAIRVPLVLKLSSDPAYERARSLGVFSGTLEEFQGPQRAPAVRALKQWRLWTVSRASRVIIPSRYLAEIVERWGIPAERIVVIPNPAPSLDGLPPRDVLRERMGLRSPTFVFAGRLVRAKNLPIAISALREVPGASLVLIGDGPERAAVERAISESGVGDRVSLKGALPRSQAIEWLRAADAAVLSSDYENFPHAAVEALAAGTPVIATSVGGVPEIVESGLNGILVPSGDAVALGAAMASLIEDRALLEGLRKGADTAVGRYASEAIFEAIAGELEQTPERG